MVQIKLQICVKLDLAHQLVNHLNPFIIQNLEVSDPCISLDW